MKVSFVITTMPALNQVFASILQGEDGHRAGIVPVDNGADIIHVIGRWDERSVKVIKEEQKKNIPTVFSSCDGLSSICSIISGNTPTCGRRIIRRIANSATVVHVCGSKEEDLVRSIAKDVHTCVIANPTITSAIKDNDVITNFTKLYDKTILLHEQQVDTNIKSKVANVCSDDKMASICRGILHVQYLVRRGNLTLEELRTLSSLMVKTPYDEDKFMTVIKKLGIAGFTSSLISVLSEKTGLTEGFMPIKPSDDKRAKSIRQAIIVENKENDKANSL